jgi:cytochrome P450
MTRDEDVHEDPENFKPERYLNANGSLNDDYDVLTFGFGRR